MQGVGTRTTVSASEICGRVLLFQCFSDHAGHCLFIVEQRALHTVTILSTRIIQIF